MNKIYKVIFNNGRYIAVSELARGNKKKTVSALIGVPLLIVSLLSPVYAQKYPLTADATANGENSIAAGTSAVADGENSIAIGENSSSNGKDNVVLGAKAKAQNMHADAPDGIFNSVVIGSEAYAGNPARNSESRGSYSVAIGSKSIVQSDYSVTIGAGANITGGSDYSIVIGGGIELDKRSVLQFSPDTILIGSGVQLSFSEKGVVVGNKGVIQASQNVAIGYASEDRVDDKLGTNFGGNYTPFTGENISYNTASDGVNSVVSFGNNQHTRRLINITAGADDTDAVNVAQLKTLAENKISFKANDSTNTTKVALGDTTNVDTNHTRLQFGILGQTGSSLSTTTENSNVYLKLDVEKLAGDLEKYQPAVPVAYTNAQGKKLIKHNNKFYDLDSVKGKVFVDGQWYNPQDLNPDGTKKNSANGTTIAEETDVSVNVINSDGTSTNPTAVGNVGSALGLTNMAPANGTKIDLADKSKYDEVRKVIAGDQFNNTGGIYSKTGSELYKAATLGDLQAVAGAGLVFKDGNSSEVHRPLGTELTIKGKDSANVDATSYSDQNLATKAENNSISIQMLKSPTFDKVTLNSQVTGTQPNANLMDTDASTIGYVNTKVAQTELKIKNHAGTETKINLASDDLQIKNGNNIATTIAKTGTNGTLTIALNQDLTSIKSIQGDGQKITLGTNGVDFGNQQLTNVASGEISGTSNQAVTGQQLNSLASQLGLTPDTAKTTFTTPTFTSITNGSGSNTNGATMTNKQPSSFKDAIDGLTTSINNGWAEIKKGLSFEDSTSQKITRQLGESLKIIAADDGQFKAQNLSIKADTTSNSIKIGLKEELTLKSQLDANNNNAPLSNLDKNLASTVGYVDAKVAAITGGLAQNLNVLNNGSDEKSLALNTAKLDMVNGENTTANVTKDQNNNLKIAFNLNSELKKITSIEGPQTGDAKLTFSTDAVTLNDKKLTGLTAGSIATGSKDAVTGGQIYSSLESVKNLLGNSFTLNNGSITAPTNIGKTGKNTIDEAIGSLKDTLDLGYYLNTMNGKSNKMALGSTFEFISATTPFMNNGIGAHYVGRNLATKINNNKVEIGLSDTPTFNKVTLGVDSSNPANNTTPGITMSATPDQGILNFAKDPANAQPADPSADNKVVLTGVKSDKNKPDSVATMADITGLQNGGLKVATGDNQTSTMKLGDTLKIVNGVNTTVSAITTDNGTHSYHIDVTGLPISYVDENNQPLVNVGGKYYAKADVTNGTVKANAQEIQPKSAQIQMPDGTLMSLKVESAIDKNNNLEGKQFTEALEAAAKDDKKKNAVATVKDLSEVNKIANKGWTLKTKADGGTVVNDTVANGEVINPENNTLTLVAGKDITLTQTQGEIKIETNNQAIVNSAVLPTKFVDDQGNQIYATKKPDGTVTYYDKPDGTGNEIAADKVSVGINSQNPLTLSGLKSAVTPDKAKATPEDFINNLVGSESDKQIKPNAIAADKAATTGDLKNMALAGMTFTATNAPDTQTKVETPTRVNIGGDVVINGGKNAKVTMSESGGKGNKMVKFTIDVNGMPMAYVNAAGETLAKVGEKFYVTLPNGELKMENGAPKEDTIAGMKLVTDQPMPLDNIGNGSLKKNSKQAVNGGQLNDLLGSDIVDAEGNPLVTVSAALKKAATEVKAGTNSPISVTKSADAQDGHAIYTVDYDQNYLHGKIRTKALELASTGGNAATITSGIGNDGVTEVSFSSAPGADGTATPVRLQGIAPGIADNDAATVGQLRDANKGIKRRIDRIEDDLGGVAATAAALASLPQSYIPGKSMVAIGTGVYRSKQAVALGVSRISDNGKIILKINASHDTTGNTTFGAGAGFLF